MFGNYTGAVVVSKPLNKEQISEYNLTIQATDEGYKGHGESSLSSYVSGLVIFITAPKIDTDFLFLHKHDSLTLYSPYKRPEHKRGLSV